ncbi:hypothetical protein, partial [Microbacterium laevaniformans]|uniref:hypothetical protein n=1 Tax=Microbacterium laevaniformans TaxID=36807 RepID=UPI0036363453
MRNWWSPSAARTIYSGALTEVLGRGGARMNVLRSPARRRVTAALVVAVHAGAQAAFVAVAPRLPLMPGRSPLPSLLVSRCSSPRLRSGHS